VTGRKQTAMSKAQRCWNSQQSMGGINGSRLGFLAQKTERSWCQANSSRGWPQRKDIANLPNSGSGSAKLAGNATKSISVCLQPIELTHIHSLNGGNRAG